MANEMGVRRNQACMIGAIAMMPQIPNHAQGLMGDVRPTKCLTSSPQGSSQVHDWRSCGPTSC